MSYTVYLTECKNGEIHTGMCKKHNDLNSKFTKTPTKAMQDNEGFKSIRWTEDVTHRGLATTIKNEVMSMTNDEKKKLIDVKLRYLL